MACPRPVYNTRKMGTQGEDKPSPLPSPASPLEDFPNAPMLEKKGNALWRLLHKRHQKHQVFLSA
jgi:hypothetical protein